MRLQRWLQMSLNGMCLAPACRGVEPGGEEGSIDSDKKVWGFSLHTDTLTNTHIHTSVAIQIQYYFKLLAAHM